MKFGQVTAGVGLRAAAHAGSAASPSSRNCVVRGNPCTMDRYTNPCIMCGYTKQKHKFNKTKAQNQPNLNNQPKSI